MKVKDGAQRYQQQGRLGEIKESFLQEVSSDLGLDVGVGFFQTGKEHGMNKCVEKEWSQAWFVNGLR